MSRGERLHGIGSGAESVNACFENRNSRRDPDFSVVARIGFLEDDEAALLLEL